VLEGEDAVNLIDKKTAVKPTVEVRDRNDLPVAGAVVTFAIRGRGASFANGVRQITAPTNSLGRATVNELTPLGKGAIDIDVTASYQGQVAAATIHQTNFASAAAAAHAGKASAPGGQSAATGSTGSTGTATTAAAAVGGGAGLSGLAIAGIVGGAAAGAATAVAVARSGDSAPQNAPPRVGSVTASATSGVQAASTITFTAQATDPENAALTYTWDFGDGSAGSGQSTTHVYASSGTFTARVTVNDGQASGSSQTTVTIKSLTGVWRSAPFLALGVVGDWTATFSQSGTALTGTFSPTAPPERFAGAVGTLSDGRVTTTSPRIVFTVTVRTPAFELLPSVYTCDPGSTADTLACILDFASGVSNVPVTLTRQ
jgi:PKD repeat protein